mmetsp:Transcript_25654/g.48627  ORF Transcript_25654/g.48627 Transcript_25654/m.48627 type:complete len:219 (+) Transcript_25654:205-861(+)
MSIENVDGKQQRIDQVCHTEYLLVAMSQPHPDDPLEHAFLPPIQPCLVLRSLLVILAKQLANDGIVLAHDSFKIWRRPDRCKIRIRANGVEIVKTIFHAIRYCLQSLRHVPHFGVAACDIVQRRVLLAVACAADFPQSALVAHGSAAWQSEHLPEELHRALVVRLVKFSLAPFQGFGCVDRGVFCRSDRRFLLVRIRQCIISRRLADKCTCSLLDVRM